MEVNCDLLTAIKSIYISISEIHANVSMIEPKSVIRLLSADKPSFCHLHCRFSVTMESHQRPQTGNTSVQKTPLSA